MIYLTCSCGHTLQVPIDPIPESTICPQCGCTKSVDDDAINNWLASKETKQDGTTSLRTNCRCGYTMQFEEGQIPVQTTCPKCLEVTILDETEFVGDRTKLRCQAKPPSSVGEAVSHLLASQETIGSDNATLSNGEFRRDVRVEAHRKFRFSQQRVKLAELDEIIRRQPSESEKLLAIALSLPVALMTAIVAAVVGNNRMHAAMGDTPVALHLKLPLLFIAGLLGGLLAYKIITPLLVRRQISKMELPNAIVVNTNLLILCFVVLLTIPTLGLAALVWYYKWSRGAKRIDSTGIEFRDGELVDWCELRVLRVIGIHFPSKYQMMVNFEFEFPRREYKLWTHMQRDTRRKTLRMFEILKPLQGTEFKFSETENPLLKFLGRFLR